MHKSKTKNATPGRHPLHVLLLEHAPQDAELTLRELKKAGFDLRCDVAATPEEFAERLRANDYDVILADYRLPGSTGMDAFELLQQQGKDVPFILVSGSLGEETAVECIKKGVTDYVLKDRLSRLPVAVHRALEEKAMRDGAARAEQALHNSEASFRLLFADNPLPMWVFDAKTLQFLQVNDAAIAHYGYSREEFLQMRITDIRPPEDIPRLLEKVRTHCSALEVGGEWGHRLKNGQIIDVEIVSHTLEFAGRDAVLVVAQDITERKRAQEALRQSSERFHRAFEDAPIGMALVARDGRWLRVNPALCQLVGYSRQELLTKTFQDITHPNDLEADLAFVRQMLAGEIRTYQMEKRYFHKSGHLVWILLSVSLVRDAAGEPLYFIAQIQDITERKRTEQQLRLQAAALQSAANAIVITQRDGQILWVNPAFGRLTGYSPEEAIGQNLRLLKSGKHDDSFYENLWKTILSGEVWHGEVTNRRKDGSLYSEEMTITPVRSAGGEISHFIAIKQDITERKQLEGQLRQAQKMEAVGRLSAGIAHDFNNLLGVIIGYGEILQERLKQDDPLRKNAEEIKKAGQRAASLTRQLLAFSRQQVLQPSVLNPNTLIKNMEEMLRRLIGENIELVVAPGVKLGCVKADPGQIEQVILNLVVNARDAMPNGGRLTIWTDNAELDQTYTRHHPPVVPGRYVMLAVSDTGCGMDAGTMTQIFEPFFTTKEAGKGTGLGLSTVYGIIKQSGGYIWVYSEPGQGATFKIYLPREDEDPETKTEQKTPDAYPRASETILLVEDEPALRNLAREILESAGYSVLEAPDGPAAIQIAEQHHGPIHLLFTDVVMPGMNGPELVRRLASLRPELKVVYMSGHTDFFGARHGVLESGTVILEKPFTRDALMRKIREGLERANPFGPPPNGEATRGTTQQIN